MGSVESSLSEPLHITPYLMSLLLLLLLLVLFTTVAVRHCCCYLLQESMVPTIYYCCMADERAWYPHSWPTGEHGTHTLPPPPGRRESMVPTLHLTTTAVALPLLLFATVAAVAPPLKHH